MKIKKANESPLIYKSVRSKRKILLMLAGMDNVKLNWFERNIYPVEMLRNIIKIRKDEKLAMFYVNTFGIPWRRRK